MLAQLQDIWSTFRVFDLIDILVVSYFLYKLYMILKDTRARTVGSGIVVLAVFALLCKFLNLHVMSWLLDKGISIIFVALPIVFQPELRRALEKIGSGKFFRNNREVDIKAMISEVLDAVEIMSRDKVGALIVFERDRSLEERIETGVHIDGVVSSRLLQNIFVKDTPLHDGAVIIRGNRIVASSCVLRLTENRNLASELGTRHRAALGISEESEAIALVVSEETGTVSIARNGSMDRYLNSKDIEGILVRELIRDNDKKTNLFFDRLQRIWGDKK